MCVCVAGVNVYGPKQAVDCIIEGLAERGILTEKQAGTLHEHRYLGNKALHELDIPDKKTLEIALNLIEHIMEDLYTVPSQVADLQRIRQNAKSSNP